MTALRAILIDPYTQKVERITLDLANGRGLLGELYQTIGCDTVTAHALGTGVDLWLDDEGLLVDDPTLWLLEGASQPFAGRGVILGHDEEGESTSCPEYVKPDDIRGFVSFPEPGTVKLPDPLMQFFPLSD